MDRKKILITGGSGFIGTNLIDLLETRKGVDIINIDIQKPKIDSQMNYWRECDIMKVNDLKQIFENEQPDYVIHLAAKTDTLSANLDDYDTNIGGVDNLILAVNEVKSVKKVIVVSTQYVYRDINNFIPSHSNVYKPHTIYGKSKVETERITKEKCTKEFVIVRPTNIWGPYNENYANGLFKFIERGLFVAPRSKVAHKSYGYVKNVAHQILNILYDSENSGAVYYVGDSVINSNKWIDQISIELIGRKPLKLPNSILYSAALFGEFLNLLNLAFPMYLTRYYNMIDDYIVPIDKTLEKYGQFNGDLNKNILETIKWYKDDYKD